MERLLADALHAEPARVRPLAELVFEKTGGNPFFAIQFLTALAEEGLLAFDPDASGWHWDMPRIRAKGFTDNVVDLMAAKLGRLPPVDAEALGTTRLPGKRRRDRRRSTLVHGGPRKRSTRPSGRPCGPGSSSARIDAYAFLHDRVQEAAYALIPEGERAAAHLRIGRLLASRTAPEEIEEKIFEIVNQLRPRRGADRHRRRNASRSPRST